MYIYICLRSFICFCIFFCLLFLGADFVEVYRGIKTEFLATGLHPGHTYKVRVFSTGDGGKSIVSGTSCFPFKAYVRFRC